MVFHVKEIGEGKKMMPFTAYLALVKLPILLLQSSEVCFLVAFDL